MRRVVPAVVAAISCSAAAWAAHADSGWVFSSSIDVCSNSGGVCPTAALGFVDPVNAYAVPDGNYIAGGIQVRNPTHFVDYDPIYATPLGLDTYTYATFTAADDRTVDYTYFYQGTDVLGTYWDPGGITVSNGYSLDFRQGVANCIPTFAPGCQTGTGSGSFTVHAGDTISIYAGVVGDGIGYGGSTVQVFGDLFDQTAGVPEPATWALTILGFAGLGAALRRGRALRAA